MLFVGGKVWLFVADVGFVDGDLVRFAVGAGLTVVCVGWKLGVLSDL